MFYFLDGDFTGSSLGHVFSKGSGDGVGEKLNIFFIRKETDDHSRQKFDP